jgi:hypothetical protein
LAGVSVDTLHNWVKRHFGGKVKRRGQGVPRGYNAAGVMALRFAADLNAIGYDAGISIRFGMQIYDKLDELVLKPTPADDLIEKLKYSVVVIMSAAGGKRDVALVDARDLGNIEFWKSGAVTTYAAGKSFLAVLESAREMDARAAEKRPARQPQAATVA